MDDGERREQRGYRITGRVQGVGFRWWTRKTGERLGVRGTVRNLPDGAVEVHAAGSGELLDRFEEELRGGPSSARVEEVRRMESRKELPDDFRIVF
ncbi:MAG TPA: acylphosphatase [Longimicrobiales bacterium]|nr:acylphosphatase [Longimicrobiales bacterium]